eukprot:TRINITY_DN31116_c0_g1_i2.p2 TRINITY_DN31116_c0_g1~~TRINITY_DN31116_c0_g1_i2.p2  ORF type:complete len:122 (-),score=11.42 TRINITY_DN31116_c0_g1_i2:520-885(-)
MNMVEGACDELPPMRQTRDNAAAAVVHGSLFVCGGIDDEGQVLSCVERFDLRARLWEAVAPLREARGNCWPAVLNGELWICGGWTQVFEPAVWERFDARRGRWEDGAAPSRTYTYGAVVVG